MFASFWNEAIYELFNIFKYRYIELFAVYHRLSQMERRLKKEQTSTANSTRFQNCDSISGSPLRKQWPNSLPYNLETVFADLSFFVNAASESVNSNEAVRDRKQLNRLRRLFVQLDFDACVVGLANATLGAGPFAIAQGVLYLRRLTLNRMMPNSTGVN